MRNRITPARIVGNITWFFGSQVPKVVAKQYKKLPSPVKLAIGVSALGGALTATVLAVTERTINRVEEPNRYYQLAKREVTATTSPEGLTSVKIPLSEGDLQSLKANPSAGLSFKLKANSLVGVEDIITYIYNAPEYCDRFQQKGRNLYVYSIGELDNNTKAQQVSLSSGDETAPNRLGEGIDQSTSGARPFRDGNLFKVENFCPARATLKENGGLTLQFQLV